MNTSKVIRTSTHIGLLVAVAIWGYLGFRYTQGDFKLFMVQSGSMQPALDIGSVILTVPNQSVAVNDVITYRTAEGIVVTHRVAEVLEQAGETMYVTKGDANTEADRVTVPHSMLIGKVSFVLPSIGKIIAFSKTLPGYIMLIMIPALYLLFHGVWGMVHAFKKDNSGAKHVEVVSS